MRWSAAQDVHRCLAPGRELTRSVDRGRPREWLLDEISGMRAEAELLIRQVLIVGRATDRLLL